MERKADISAREVIAALLLGLAAYLRYSVDPNPDVRKYRFAFGVVTALGGLLPRVVAGRPTHGSKSGARILLLQIGAIGSATGFALARRFTQKPDK